MVLRLHYGNAVVGDQRFGRPALERRFLSMLANNAGVKMFGLRRIGKSTFRQIALDDLAARGVPHAYVDGQSAGSLLDLLGRIFAALPEQTGIRGRVLGLVSNTPVRAVLDGVGTATGNEAATVSAYWQIVSDAIRRALAGSGTRPVLVIDEFSYLINNMIDRDPVQGRIDADKLLASMREWRGGGMAMLLTGSIGLTALLRRAGLSTEHLNDLQPFDVPELTAAEARDFIAQATAGSAGRWTAAHTDEFLRQTGSLYPCFLVRGLLEVGVAYPAAPEGFEEIFDEQVRPLLYDDFLNQFLRRYIEYAALPHGERDGLILPALRAIMTAAGGCDDDRIPCAAPFGAIQRETALAMLREDGFVRYTQDREGRRRWRPASSIAALWWRRAGLA